MLGFHIESSPIVHRITKPVLVGPTVSEEQYGGKGKGSDLGQPAGEVFSQNILHQANVGSIDISSFKIVFKFPLRYICAYFEKTKYF